MKNLENIRIGSFSSYSSEGGVIRNLVGEIEQLQRLLTKCAVILERAPPNYYDYGEPHHWDNAVQHKMGLLQHIQTKVEN